MKIVDIENIINVMILNYIPCLLQNKFLIDFKKFNILHK